MQLNVVVKCIARHGNFVNIVIIEAMKSVTLYILLILGIIASYCLPVVIVEAGG